MLSVWGWGLSLGLGEGFWCGWVVLDEDEDGDDLMGDSRENSRTISSSSESGKSSSSSSSPLPFSSSSEEVEETSGSFRGAATGLICVGSKEKSRSWVEIRERRSAVSSFVVRGLKGGGGGGGGHNIGMTWGREMVGGAGGGESSRWIWVLLTKKSSRLSSGIGSGFGGFGGGGMNRDVPNLIVRISSKFIGDD